MITSLKGTSYDFAYQTLYIMAAIITVFGAVLVVKVKSVP